MQHTIRNRIEHVNTQPHYTFAYCLGMNFRTWLEHRMAENGLTIPDLIARDKSRKLNQPTIYRITTGETKNPRIETVRLIEAALGEKQPTDSNTEPGPEIRGRVPLLSTIQAGDYAGALDGLRPGDVEMIPTTAPAGQHTFALRVVGDSMEPDIPAGVILIVEPDMEAQAGDYVVVRNGEQANIKQLVRDGDDWYLKPANREYKTKPLPADATIIGVVRAMERKFR